MATVGKNTAIAIAANEGYYPGDDIRVLKIVKYNNQFDGRLAYGLVYEKEDQFRYEKSPACHNVEIVWELNRGLISTWE